MIDKFRVGLALQVRTVRHAHALAPPEADALRTFARTADCDSAVCQLPVRGWQAVWLQELSEQRLVCLAPAGLHSRGQLITVAPNAQDGRRQSANGRLTVRVRARLLL